MPGQGRHHDGGTIKSMRLNDAPEHDCPDCDEHPPLVYEDSVGPAGFMGPSGRVEDGLTFHFYTCAICGKRFRAIETGSPMVTPPNQEQKTPEKRCFSCGSAMHVTKVANGPVSSAKRNFDCSYSRVETTLVWQCTECGTTDKLKHTDVLGFN